MRVLITQVGSLERTEAFLCLQFRGGGLRPRPRGESSQKRTTRNFRVHEEEPLRNR